MEEKLFADIRNKSFVLTGGNGVLGTVFAKGLLCMGAKVAIIDYKKERCEKCVESLHKETGGDVIGAVASVLDKEALLQAKNEILSKFGTIDVLINGAGGNAPSATTKSELMFQDTPLQDSFFGLDLEGFRKVFDLNIIGTVLPSMVFSEAMLPKGGVIINISSMNSFRPLTKIPAYSGAKAAVNNFTEWLAVHFAKVNIRVNAIAPGFYLTNQNRFLLIDESTGALTARGNKIIAGTPMGRFGEPEELLGTLYYLSSDASKFVTGVVIPVDGGFSAYSGV